MYRTFENNLEKVLFSIFSIVGAIEWSKTKSTSKRLELTEHFVRVLPEGETKADGFITLATYLFHLAVQVTQDRDFKLAIK